VLFFGLAVKEIFMYPDKYEITTRNILNSSDIIFFVKDLESGETTKKTVEEIFDLDQILFFRKKDILHLANLMGYRNSKKAYEKLMQCHISRA